MSPVHIHKPAGAYIHGVDGAPVVLVPARIAAILVNRAGLARYHHDHRGLDPELDQVLVALRDAGHRWAAAHSANPTTSTNTVQPPEARSPWLSTTEAARQLRMTPQGVTRALREQRLDGLVVGGRWLLNPEDVAHFAARRSA
jgi:excisionase family DNA binding protein